MYPAGNLQGIMVFDAGDVETSEREKTRVNLKHTSEVTKSENAQLPLTGTK